ncbi:hypothetical protein PTIM40_75 [Cyanophage P-TIM40]|uniref:Uncharacterized protein n=1 Tax=Cyanophage P-TIM40 TaxID=1589733 RepID=A0A0C5ADW5_9CAUD|nr:hypothetical protein AU107_gp075 [Cyanophage P-TIM40]AJK27502.1 hypothetical protein PTIM40_75 [Cyanophage P-TIM40]
MLRDTFNLDPKFTTQDHGHLSDKSITGNQAKREHIIKE